MNLREELVARYCVERTVERRNAVVDAHRHLCVRGARKFKRAINDRADLEQVAAVGLIKAAEYYRDDMQTPFEAYAWIMIVGELMHYVRDHERLVRVPRALRALEKRFAAAWETFVAMQHREPTNAELAKALNVSPEVVGELQILRRAEHARLSDLNEPDEPEAVEILPATEHGPSIEDRIELALALAELGERERTIVVGTYAAGFTQTELGDRLGLSQSHVSKLLSRALVRLGKRVA